MQHPSNAQDSLFTSPKSHDEGDVEYPQKGAIKTSPGIITANTTTKFQYQKGAIKTDPRN